MARGLGNDLRHAVRALARSPGFSGVAVLSLAIAIGANTAMFGVVRTLLLTPLEVDAPRELALLTWARDGEFSINQVGSTSYTDPEGGRAYRSNFSYPIYTALRDAAPASVELFAFAFLRGVSVAVEDQPALLAGGALVNGRYFSGLGARMALGRPLDDEDDAPGAPLVAVLGHSLWMRAFGGDPDVLGRTVRVNGNPAEVVGVTAAGFHGLSMGGFFPQTEVTVPLAAQPLVYPRMAPGRSLVTADDVFWLRLMARVPEAADQEPVEEALTRAMREQPSPLVGGDGNLPVVRLLPGAQGAQPVHPETARLLYFLWGVVGIVLLIACVNLASLMLARGVSRQRETAVRRALGCGRARLVAQVLIESLVLAGAGTALGLVLTLLGRELLGGLLTGSLGTGAFGNVDMRVGLDPVVAGVSAGLGVAATLLFGLLPALRLSSIDPGAWLRHRAAGSATPRLTLSRALVGLQIAVSVPLVVGAALFLRTVANIGAVELGFDPSGLVSFQVDPGYTRLPADQYPRLHQDLLARVQEVPGVRSATLVENALMSGIVSNTSITVDGRSHLLYLNAVGPAFLETMGMRLIEGRVPGLQDGPDAPLVGAVNETAVRELFGGASPLDRVLQLGGRDVRIVGVVNDTPYRSRRDRVPPTLYDDALQREGYGGHHLVLRTDVPLGRLEPIVREVVSSVDTDLPVPELRSQAAVMAQTSARERVFTELLTMFGGFALLLASIGLHGVTSYAVTRRTNEIGVRVAVGARPRQVLWLVLRQVLALALAGLAVGIPLALGAAPVAASLLYGVAPDDVPTVVAASMLLLAIAAVAGLVPALRAARLDPTVALAAD